MKPVSSRCHTICRSAIITLSFLLTICSGFYSPANANQISIGEIRISKLWSRATPKGARVGVGYLTVDNLAKKPERLISGRSKIAERIEIHAMSISNGIMTMRRLANGLVIGPRATIEFKPGGYHLMFIGLKKPIVTGESFEASLVFENAGTADVFFKAEGIGSPGPK